MLMHRDQQDRRFGSVHVDKYHDGNKNFFLFLFVDDYFNIYHVPVEYD